MGLSLDEKVINIRYAVMDDYPWLIAHEKHISEKILKHKIENLELYVVENNDKIIGWLRYNLFWDNIPFLNMLYFLEEYRRIGIGTRLVKYWENEMRQKGYKIVFTSTLSNEEAQHFYRKMGYKEIGGIKYLDEPYELIFQKELL
jgi:ribosomal protein S18 acetylase RimI-like enzyme